MAFEIVCQNCGQSFESRYSHKKFCTLSCYHTSPQFQAMLKANVVKGVIALRGRPPQYETLDCLHCGKTVPTKPSRSSKRSVHKYCSHKCYREYMAGRFDRHIASPESLALPQNYDEFLTGAELRCLVEGCNWSGIQLSSHMNFTHGIKKDEFKRLAGFNASTGVVTADYSERLSEAKKEQGCGADHMSKIRAMIRNPTPPSHGGRYRLEGKEHARKARMLVEKPITEFQCLGCGKLSRSVEWIQKYCSVKCRDDYYARRNAEKQYPFKCEVCKQDFAGNIYQKRRDDQDLPVVCSFRCRQRRAGHIARGTWAGR